MGPVSRLASKPSTHRHPQGTQSHTITHTNTQHSRMASMAFANYRRRSQVNELNKQAQAKAGQDANTGCFPQVVEPQDFGAKQMTTFFEENNKTLTKKWSCDEEGVPINNKWAPTFRVRTFSFGADYLSGSK